MEGPLTLRIYCDILATVWRVCVAPGDTVEAGQPLVLLESMKMEIPVVAPGRGTVHAVAVVEGVAVDDGDLLVELA